jgi:hydrogenase expression/formation protein HypE
MGHGGGGRLMQELIAEVFRPAFDNPLLETRHDGALLDLPRHASRRLAFTTDSYVVKPLVFPGGDIGALAVNGTVNDLAMCGARPLWLSCGFILEEGLSLDVLSQVAASMRSAADGAGVALVTGDTKVVEKGGGDGLYVNTTGIGLVTHSRMIRPASVRPGDRLIVSGDLGRHGVAILAARESLGFETTLESDCAPLAAPVLALLAAGVDVRCLRDLTRGGLGAALNEIARDARLSVSVDEPEVPVGGEVASACEALGLDPLYVANEGRFVAFVAPAHVERALWVLHGFPVCSGARAIGEAETGPAGLVTARSGFDTLRVLDVPSGEQLPRTC